MSKPYVIKNKVLRIVQSLIDEAKAHPENKMDILKETCQSISKEDITDEHLKEVIEKMISEFKDFSYEEIFDEIQKMKGGF